MVSLAVVLYVLQAYTEPVVVRAQLYARTKLSTFAAKSHSTPIVEFNYEQANSAFLRRGLRHHRHGSVRLLLQHEGDF